MGVLDTSERLTSSVFGGFGGPPTVDIVGKCGVCGYVENKSAIWKCTIDGEKRISLDTICGKFLRLAATVR